MDHMRSLATALLVLTVSHSASAIDAPFLPPTGAVDYVATFAPISGAGTRIVYHSNGKTRVDFIDAKQTISRYASRDHPTTVTIVRDTNGRYRSIEVTKASFTTSPWSDVKKSESSEEILGERCDIWKTATVPPLSRPAFSQVRCVTKDGVELSIKHFLSERATAVERRNVRAAEINPPTDILDLESWLDSDIKSFSGSRPPDFETVLKPKTVERDTFDTTYHITQRHFPWVRHEIATSYEDILAFEHSEAELDIRLIKYKHIELKKGVREPFQKLTIARSPKNAAWAASWRRTQTILGEQCSWFDPSPGVSHKTLQCRTADGIVVADLEINYGVREREAVQFSRREIDSASVLPPAEILSRSYWGLPQ
jgi:hypothetical protein